MYSPPCPFTNHQFLERSTAQIRPQVIKHLAGPGEGPELRGYWNAREVFGERCRGNEGHPARLGYRLIHRLRQRSRTADKVGVAVVRRRDAVRARGQRRGCELCRAAAASITQFTVCTTDPELPVMLEVPLYVAVTVVFPAGNANVVRLALPPARLTVPSVVVPAVNVTVPTGTTVGDLTVALNVTFCPKTDGFGEEVTVVVVVA